jgi:glutamate racemase
VLGCTHYPLLKKIIMRVMGLEVALVDSAEETAKEVKRVLSENKLMNENSTIPANFEYFVSDDPEKFVKLGKNFLGKEITNIEKIEL